MKPAPFDPLVPDWKQYLLYPRVLLTMILCGFMLFLHIACGLYAWFFER